MQKELLEYPLLQHLLTMLAFKPNLPARPVYFHLYPSQAILCHLLAFPTPSRTPPGCHLRCPPGRGERLRGLLLFHGMTLRVVTLHVLVTWMIDVSR